MRRAICLVRAGTWDGRAANTVTLPFADRHRRRCRMIDDIGEPFLLDLPHAVLLADGDGLELDQGSRLRIQAAAEPTVEIAASSVELVLRIAWHIGNRHTPLQVLGDGRLRILADPVMEAMVAGLGGLLTPGQRPFSPEPGAYTDNGASHHAHDHA